MEADRCLHTCGLPPHLHIVFILSLLAGDVVVDATVIDDGWMEGRVQRTGQYGMLPSNYVEKM